MNITFLLNGETVDLSGVQPTTTLLQWLRETRGLTGTKEGCNEGDCGACSVTVQDETGMKALNACILFLPQLHGKAVRTVEGMASSDGSLHPVQAAMITCHGSQCGFCTPGFITSMVAAHKHGDKNWDDALAGNLCRCTGYAPIIRAAEQAAQEPAPDWIDDTLPEPSQLPSNILQPESIADLASLYEAQPEATLVAGATDVGLWVTKELRTLEPVIFLGRCAPLKEISESDDQLFFGAGVTMNEMREAITPHFKSYGDMLRRYASSQIRNAATLGGNIANGSPIGDNAPALIALGARVHLRRGHRQRSMPMETFFIEYGKQDRQPGEFIEFISIPKQPDRLKVYKLSKRFDQDISAVLGAFNVTIEDDQVREARIAFGGMAGIPKRASHVENALLGNPWTEETIAGAWAAWAEDFTPMTDMRASAEYRLDAARNLLTRYFLEDLGAVTSVLEVQP